jgi:hypothetical protein
MAQISVWHAKFHLETSSGRMTSGPYSTFVGISGGSRGDQQAAGTAASVKTAVTNNLASLLGVSVAPAGTVVIDEFTHGSVPDIWT